LTETMTTDQNVPSIDTLVEDIYGLFGSDKIELKPEHLETFKNELSQLVTQRLRREDNEHRRLRLSAIGKKDRQLWYDMNYTGETETLPASALIKFMYGDVLEHLMLLLARQAGHIVEMEQAEVEIEDVKGHPDAVIDGVVVDVKSAASHMFNRFESGNLEAFADDVFLGSYMSQLASYVEAINPEADGAFLAIDKTLGKLCLMKIPNDVLRQYKIRERVEYVKEMVRQLEVPPRCFEPKPKGKGGNFVLSSGCSYCPHKFHCWSDVNDGTGLRTYVYSSGPEYFTHVEKEPRVIEEF
jgi:hypothetical protein